MFRKFLAKQLHPIGLVGAWRRGRFSLQMMLWALWSLGVAAVAYVCWRSDMSAARPLNTLGLAIHCAVAGVIGLVVITIVEMRLEPWRFVDRKEDRR